MQQSIKRWHYVSGIVLSVFIGFHLVNQLFSLAGPEAHIHLMNVFRVVYRFPPVEALLLAAAVSQQVSGIRLLFNPGKKSTVEKLQRYSGMYLSFFLLAHVSAVLLCRYFHFDSNFWFAAAGLNYRPFTLYFFPYYFLAVTGIAVHIATIHYQKTGSRRGSAVIAVFGIVTAFLILVGFTNGFRFRDVPVPYQELVLHFHAHP